MSAIAGVMILKGIGTLTALSGSRGKARKLAARGKEVRLYKEIAAGQVVAVGQRRALEEKRQAKLLASRAVAVAAAGGASQDIDHLLADIEGEGFYRASIAMYEAESESERLKFEGLQAEKYGVEQASATRTKGIATALNIGASMFGDS